MRKAKSERDRIVVMNARKEDVAVGVQDVNVLKRLLDDGIAIE